MWWGGADSEAFGAVGGGLVKDKWVVDVCLYSAVELKKR